jgi:hypothetical protein
MFHGCGCASRHCLPSGNTCKHYAGMLASIMRKVTMQPWALISRHMTVRTCFHARTLPLRRSGCFPLSSYFGAVCINDDGIALRSRFLLAVCVCVCVCVCVFVFVCVSLSVMSASRCSFCLYLVMSNPLTVSPPRAFPTFPHPPLVLPRTTLHALL